MSLQQWSIDPAHSREIIVMGHDDFAVTRHVDVEFKILHAPCHGGAKGFERVLGIRTGGAAMPNGARAWKFEEVSVDMVGQGIVSIENR